MSIVIYRDKQGNIRKFDPDATDTKEYSVYRKYKYKNIKVENHEIEKLPRVEPKKEKGFSEKEEDVKNLYWLADTFGGEVIGNNEQGNPDYTFRGKYLELKTINNSNISTIDKRVQKGLHQIRKNPYGLLLDITKAHQPKDVIEKAVGKRVDLSGCDYDVVTIFKDGQKCFVKKYKRK